ncbi:MAG TPA: hypothetical protein VNF46_03215 [Gammaproteobacteria bacterium]|nr:hypothetical protein [Gammaproteobacteria bacterium]
MNGINKPTFALSTTISGEVKGLSEVCICSGDSITVEVNTMFEKRTSLFMGLAAGLILALTLNQPVMAMGGYTGDQVGKGLIQKIDYLHHTITVNGQTYAVSPTAKFNGVAAYSILSIGMPIQFMLGDTASSDMPGPKPARATVNTAGNQPQMIVSITWLPAGIK